jgi:DNA-binding HxlR family transcriptional regulator
MAMMFPESISQRSGCPISSTLDIVGDKWSLIIVRDMLSGKSRYGEFQDSPEGIPTNILSERLKRLEAAGLVKKIPYQERPVRNAYTLTEAGIGLKPVVQALCRWANEFFPDTWNPPASFMDS